MIAVAKTVADLCTKEARALMCEGLLAIVGKAESPSDLLPCPPTAALANIDQRFMSDSLCNSGTRKPCLLNPGADLCAISVVPSPSGAGQQCCYKSGNILLGSQGKPQF
jgi:hypothetical protein